MPYSKSSGKCSPGILRKSRNNRDAVRPKTSKKLNIRVHDPSRPVDPREAEAEERKFAELKRQYFHQCAPINKSVVRKCTRSSDCDDLDMHIFKTVRGNLKAFHENRNETVKDGEAVERKKRNVSSNAENTKDVNRRTERRGCGAMGCNCQNCVCGVNCQLDCKCMRHI